MNWLDEIERSACHAPPTSDERIILALVKVARAAEDVAVKVKGGWPEMEILDRALASARGDTPKADAPPRVEAEPRTCENCACTCKSGPGRACVGWQDARPAPPAAPTEVEHTCANCGTKCYANGTWPQVVACAMGIKEIRDRWTPRDGIPGGAKGGTR